MPSHAITTFEQWRDEARRLLHQQTAPERVDFVDGWQPQTRLQFPEDDAAAGGCEFDQPAAGAFRVPKSFLKTARLVACHRAPQRWNVLYRILWRLTHAERRVMDVVTDDDVYTVRTWEQQVRRDVHKMKAFVRFRRCVRGDGEWFVAWHRPDYRIATLVGPFFVDRFAALRWAILTPAESLSWDLARLHYGPGTGRDAAPQQDQLEEMWLAYYASTFNPARVRLQVMRAQMPQRHWPTLPETAVIDELLEDAPQRVARMIDQQAGQTRQQERGSI